MDYHHIGKAKTGQGAVPVTRGVPIGFATATGTYGILETLGATTTYPILVEAIVVIGTAFNGTAAPVLLVEGYDGTNTVSIMGANDVTEGTVGSYYKAAVLTADTKIRINWTVGTGTPSTGSAWVFIRIAGKGMGKYIDNPLIA